jgi:ABC-type phosphate transport system substrate-binding protein
MYAVVHPGDFDIVISAATITEEREELVDFSAPYFNAQQTIVIPEAGTIVGPDDLSGQRVRVLAGSTGADWVEQQPVAAIQSYTDPVEMFQAVAQGAIDAAIYDAPAARSYINEQPDLGLKIVDTPLTNEEYGIAVRSDRSELLACVNSGLAQVCADGTYAEIFTDWFDRVPDPEVCATITGATTITSTEQRTTTPASDSATAPATALCLRGSNTILGTEMAGTWRETFAQEQNIDIQIDDTGTQAAVEATLAGECVNLLAASEALTEDQINQLAAADIRVGDQTIIGRDVIVFVTNPGNSVAGVTVAQLAEILLGSITNWEAVGGADQPIQVFLRTGSGTTNEVFIVIADFEPFVTVPGEPFPPDPDFIACGEDGGNAACLEQAQTTPGALYWSSKALIAGYDLRVIPILTADGTSVDPGAPDFDPDAYPEALQRPLYMYPLDRAGTDDAAAVNAAQTFLDYILSDAGRQVLADQGFQRR